MESILIFGGAGFLGKELIRKYNNCSLSIFSRDEAKHWSLKNEYPHVQTFIGDVRNKSRVREVIKMCNPDAIIIASAMKQIGQCENHPYESVETNIIGIRNVIEEAGNLEIKQCLFISTDKACMPINVYGMCKGIAEKIAANASERISKTSYYIARYGNILGSTGSIIPLFQFQSQHAECFTVTHPKMTRYFMQVSDSSDLIDDLLREGHSGDIWLPVLPSLKIMDLAELFSEKYNKPIKVIGIKEGEKLAEHLISPMESMRAVKNGNYYIIKPRIIDSNESFSYSSNDGLLTKKELHTRLVELGIF